MGVYLNSKTPFSMYKEESKGLYFVDKTDLLAQLLQLFEHLLFKDLAAVINLIYLSARDHYRIEREDKAGTGYVDFIFYPQPGLKIPGIILELQIDHTPEQAIQQIKDRKYALRFSSRLGEIPTYTEKILAVGIAYNRKTKRHSCKIKYLEEKLPG